MSALMREIEEKLNQVSPTFCLAKWKQVTLHLHNGFTHSCHHVKSHKIPTRYLQHTPSTLHNTPTKQKHRSEMLAGKRPKECQYCWNIEDVGAVSDRTFKSSESWAQPFWQEVQQPAANKTVHPSYLEISFENTCNFKCMYCGPQFSSKWYEEIKKHGAYPTWDRFNSLWHLWLERRKAIPRDKNNPYVEAFWSWWPTLKKDLRIFRITGGEPLLSPHVWRVLESLEAQPEPHLDLAINSNMGVATPLVDKLIRNVNRLQNKVKSFTLYTSLDTVGPQAEYIRYGLNYNLYCRHVERVLDEVSYPITVSYMITVNALSLPGTLNLLKLIHQQRLRHTRHHIGLDTPYLRNPPFMSVAILPAKYAFYLDQALTYMRENQGPHAFNPWEIERLERVREWMVHHDLSLNQIERERSSFKCMFQEYDRRRGTSFLTTFPEYSEFWQSL